MDRTLFIDYCRAIGENDTETMLDIRKRSGLSDELFETKLKVFVTTAHEMQFRPVSRAEILKEFLQEDRKQYNSRGNSVYRDLSPPPLRLE